MKKDTKDAILLTCIVGGIVIPILWLYPIYKLSKVLVEIYNEENQDDY